MAAQISNTLTIVTVPTSECARQMALPPQQLLVFGVREASWRQCELCSQNQEHLHYTVNFIKNIPVLKTKNETSAKYFGVCTSRAEWQMKATSAHYTPCPEKKVPLYFLLYFAKS